MLKKQGWIHLNDLLEKTEEFIEDREDEYTELNDDLPSSETAAIVSKDEIKDHVGKRMQNITHNIPGSEFEAKKHTEEFDYSEKYGKLLYGKKSNRIKIKTPEDEWSIGDSGSDHVADVLGRLTFGYTLDKAIDEVYSEDSKRPSGIEILVDKEGCLREGYKEDAVEMVKEELVDPSNEWYEDSPNVMLPNR